MTEVSRIVKPGYAPAREPIAERLKQLINARIHIRKDAGAGDGKMPIDKYICIMEATAYILGYDRITDAPPCTSKIIRDLMIELNDNIDSDRKRAQLKHLVPDIINTAPTKWMQDRIELRQIKSDPDYIAAERTRREMIKAFGVQHKLDGELDSKEIYDLPMPILHEFIRQLAAVAKFDTPARPEINEGEQQT